MSTKRSGLISKIKDKLDDISGLTAIPYHSIPNNLSNIKKPVCFIFSGQFSSDKDELDTDSYTYMIELELWNLTSSIETQIEAINGKMYTNKYWSGDAENTVLMSISEILPLDESNQYSVVNLTYQIKIRTAQGAI